MNCGHIVPHPFGGPFPLVCDKTRNHSGEHESFGQGFYWHNEGRACNCRKCQIKATLSALGEELFEVSPRLKRGSLPALLEEGYSI